MKKIPTDKKYKVYFEMKNTHDIRVKATDAWQAKTRAFLKLIGMLTKKHFTIYVDLEE